MGKGGSWEGTCTVDRVLRPYARVGKLGTGERVSIGVKGAGLGVVIHGRSGEGGNGETTALEAILPKKQKHRGVGAG